MDTKGKHTRRWGGRRSRPAGPWARRLRRLADLVTAASLMFALAVGVAWITGLGEQEIAGPFRAVDGDSLEAGDGRQLRLLGIDAPEYVQDCRRDGTSWPCGREAARALRGLTRGVSVRCSGAEIDRYERLLVTCFSGSTNINGEMVRRGMALANGSYFSEEAEARSARAGIWAGAFDTPREWREQHADSGTGEAEDARSLLAGLANRARLWLRLAADRLWPGTESNAN